ncbi:hypothetical protein [Burkholderia gladioli]|uniref:hypothetical protein n=1 Tax=Burkholderia gladioli TaxID=28095 RepID=UPI00163F3283|nr:hypothetical protein [Burkholderia gladioli]
MSESKQRGDAVAVVGTTYQLLWNYSGSFQAFTEKQNLKVGDRLYHGPAAEAAPELVEALRIAEAKLVELEAHVGGGDDEIYVEGAILTIRAALAKAGAIDQPRATKPVAEPARHPTICSFCLEPNCNGECSGDGGMGD